MEVTRGLHNYVASVMTLVEHTRIFARETYEKTQFWTEYQAAINARFESPLPHFVQDLRDYTLHYRLPMTGASTSWKQGEEHLKTRIMLDVESFRDWNGWSPQARENLKGLAKDAELLEIIEAYFFTVQGFYQWLAKRQAELHREELAEVRQLQEKLSALIG